MYTIFIPLLLTLHAQHTSADVTSRHPITYCSRTTTTSAAYRSATKTLLSLLSTSTNASLFHSASVGPAHGLYLCRADVAQSTCKSCVSAASSDLLTRCPRATGAAIWYSACMLRYSNESFLGHADTDGFNATEWEDNGANPASLDAEYETRVNKVVANALSTAALDAAYGDATKFGTETRWNEDVWKVKVVAQCTPDITNADCYGCLVKCIVALPKCCSTKNATTVFLSCNAGYEILMLQGGVGPSPAPAMEFPETKKRLLARRIIQIVVVGASLVILLILILSLWLWTRKKKIVDEDDIIAVESLRMEFNMIRVATQNFSIERKLGQGGFGEVYKGTLENGQDIAVKRLAKNSCQGTIEFRTEVVLVAKLQHRNLVKLLGFCMSGKEKILVYEFLPNSSLDKILFDQIKRASLNWETRFKIILGIAKGLLYLHEDSRLTVIHRDLKSSNILLDRAMNPKIADFGLAKLFGVDQTQDATNRIVGTFGYMAPEYKFTGHYSVKSDVYSFGVMVLEIVTGQRSYMNRPEYGEALLHRAWRLWNDGATLCLVDETLEDNYSREEVIKCIDIGLLSIQESANKRPSMTTIVASLGGQVVDLPLPLPPSFFITNNSTSVANVSACETLNSSMLYPR